MTEQERDAKVASFKESTVRSVMAGVNIMRAMTILLRAKMDEKGIITGAMTEGEIRDGGPAMEDMIKGRVAGLGAMIDKLLSGVPKPAVLETVVLSKLIATVVDMDDAEDKLRSVFDETFAEAKAKRIGPYDPSLGENASLGKIMKRFTDAMGATAKPTQPAPKGGLKN